MQAKTTNILHQNQTTQQLQIIKEKMKNIPTKLHQSAKKDYYTQNDEILYDLQSIYSTVPFRRDFYFILLVGTCNLELGSMLQQINKLLPPSDLLM